MSKIKIAIVTLSLIATGAAMVACNDGPRANHDTIGEGAPLGSSKAAEAGETEAQKLAREMQERQDRMETIASKLNYAANKSYDESKCSNSAASDLKSKVDFQREETINNQVIVKIGSLNRLNSVLNVSGVRLATKALVDEMTSNENLYCSINMASTVAKRGKFFLSGYGMDGQSAEEGEELIEKAEIIANAVSPLVSDLMNKIYSLEAIQEFQANAGRLSAVENQVASKIASLSEKNAEIRSYFKCDETSDSCDSSEILFVGINKRSEEFINKAKVAITTYGTSSIEGPGDQNLGGKIEVLEKISAELNTQNDTADRVLIAQAKNELKQPVPAKMLGDQGSAFPSLEGSQAAANRHSAELEAKRQAEAALSIEPGQ